MAIAAVGTSGPLIAATAAPALAIAFWRNVFGAAALTPFTLWRHLGELRALSGAQWLSSLFAGVALGLHFSAWTPSLTMTSVASATAFAAAQPIFAALIARLRGENVSRQAWLGIVIAVVGVVALSGVDLRVSLRAFSGDLLALLAGALAAIYMTVGASVRKTVSLAPYAVVCYSTAAFVLAGLALATGEHLGGLSGDAWLKILGLTAGAQLLGHTLFNRVLKTTSATVVSLCILLEVPAAALIAALWLRQVPSWSMVPGAVLILAGLAVVTLGGGTAASEAAASGGATLDADTRGTDHPGVPETLDVTGQ
ncbi:DMT family transporter [Actinocrinis puniceicyclus]|uniref:DMT family transporter n=1 Tax=Actinocrinis puniceicyclus TaxID=977794 RepID=A0A8J8BB47_9ACTN|nr:DMT family transporter [Actinocrinis puniceicyclus]MBS2963652.1 DMT family transporter [Actinocrinis puniceicyclus]